MFNIYSEFYFPKQFIISDDIYYPSYKDQLIEFCYEQQKLNPDGEHYSNVGGWQSDVDVFFKGEEYKYKFFKHRLFENIKECLNNHYMLHEDCDFYVDRMWINISKHNDYNADHTHPWSHFVGVFYVKTADDCGNISVSPNAHANDYQELLYRKEEICNQHLMHPTVDFIPKEGRLLLFPSSLSHLVRMNKSNSDRISISFDIVFTNKK